jgi:hypothetical protein
MPTPRQRLPRGYVAMGHRRNKTSLLHDLTRTGGQAQSLCSTPLSPHCWERHEPVKSPLHDVGQLADEPDGPSTKLIKPCGSASKRHRASSMTTQQMSWWSQTGSNRRPHACKARALPAELWPLRTPELGMRQWWAWEDLNFRPHAYQARALTN